MFKAMVLSNLCFGWFEHYSPFWQLCDKQTILPCLFIQSRSLLRNSTEDDRLQSKFFGCVLVTISCSDASKIMSQNERKKETKQQIQQKKTIL